MGFIIRNKKYIYNIIKINLKYILKLFNPCKIEKNKLNEFEENNNKNLLILNLVFIFIYLFLLFFSILFSTYFLSKFQKKKCGDWKKDK